MPFEVQGIEPLTAVINVRVTREEKERLKEEADYAGLSVSSLMRRKAFGRRIVAHADEVMIKELRRLGGLLKHVHSESQGAYSEETGKALGEVRTYLQRLSHDR